MWRPSSPLLPRPYLTFMLSRGRLHFPLQLSLLPSSSRSVCWDGGNATISDSACEGTAIVALPGRVKDISMKYESVIGLEVHAQLLTKSKLFCSCATVFQADPNDHTCPICLGMPGVLPVLNHQAVEFAIRTGLAMQGQVTHISRFARKNYFYPDLPKGYQISQYEEPLIEGGGLSIDVDGTSKYIRLIRIHLEEDAGKSIHGE